MHAITITFTTNMPSLQKKYEAKAYTESTRYVGGWYYIVAHSSTITMFFKKGEFDGEE